MKRFSITKFSLVITLLLLVCSIFLLVLSLVNNVYEKSDSIVFIKNIQDNLEKDGMGVVYKNNNGYTYIVTNYHVIESNDELYVYNHLNEKEHAEVVSCDLFTDIAIIRIQDNLYLKEAKVSNMDLKVNDEVVYYDIDSELFDSGKVLSLNNELISNGSYYNAGMIEANVEYGNSGSALFNVDDEVVGLISLKDEITENGFYIPMTYVMSIVNKLEKNKLFRPNLGTVFVDSTNTEILEQYGLYYNDINGVVILDTSENSLLYKNGFMNGDLITKINDDITENVVMFQKKLYSYSSGSLLNLEYYRDNQLLTTSIILE